MKKSIVSKRVAVAILSAATALAPITGSLAVPVSAFAKESDAAVGSDNPEGGYVEYISDYMENNYGSVDTNGEELVNNYGTVRSNNQDSIIHYNNGTVTENNGNIYHNYGEVSNNYRCGCVYNTGGTVINNYEESTVVGGHDYEGKENVDGVNGTIVNNIGGDAITGYGADDLLTITNYYYGDVAQGYKRALKDGTVQDVDFNGKIHITNNFSENTFEDKDFVTVEKQYHSVDLADAENVNVSYDGFTFGDYDKKQYAKVAENSKPVKIDASITLKPGHGYKLSDNGKTRGETDKLSYTLDKYHDGSYTVKIKELKGNAVITLEDLNLKVCKKH